MPECVMSGHIIAECACGLDACHRGTLPCIEVALPISSGMLAASARAAHSAAPEARGQAGGTFLQRVAGRRRRMAGGAPAPGDPDPVRALDLDRLEAGAAGYREAVRRPSAVRRMRCDDGAEIGFAFAL